MRVGRQASAVDLLAELQDLLVGETALDEGTRVDPRRRVTLDVHQVSTTVGRRGSPEVLEAHVIQSRR
jgi:hypothetical protein